MPSSIQTSPPAMHRRSLHPNRIYPAINGLDPELVDQERGAIQPQCERQLSLARSRRRETTPADYWRMARARNSRVWEAAYIYIYFATGERPPGLGVTVTIGDPA